MALDNKVLIDEEVLTTLSNKAFGDGITHPIEDIVDNLGPNATDYFTNTEKYGYIVGNGTSSAALGTVTLPEGIDFNDVVLAVGIGGFNNSSISARSALHINYIYCPALYNHVAGLGSTGEPNEKDCFGFIFGTYSTTYEHDAWTPLAHGSTYGSNLYRPTFYKATDASDGKHRVGLGFYQNETLSSYTGYIAAKYGSVVIIYRKK